MKMSRWSFNGVQLLLVLSTLMVFGQACSDESLQQYRDSQEQSDAAALQPAVGTYTGQVTAITPTAGQSSLLGAMTVNVAIDTTPQKSSDTLTSEASATLTGSVEYFGPDAVYGSAPISSASFPPDGSNHFIANVTFNDASGGPHTLVLDTHIVSGNMSGTVIIDNQTNSGGNIALSSNATPGTTPGSLSAGVGNANLDAERQTYFSTQGSANYEMHFNELNQNPQQVFLQVFYPVHSMLVQVSDDGTNYCYNAVLNYQSILPTLRSVSSASGAGTSGNGCTPGSNLSCTQILNNRALPDWDCTLNDRVEVIFSAKPVSNSGTAAPVPAATPHPSPKPPRGKKR